MANPIQGELDIQDTAGSLTRIKLNGDTAHISAGGHGQNGDIVLIDSADKERIHIGRDKLGKPPNERWVWTVNIMNSLGKKMAMLNEEGDLYLGGKGADGDIVVTDKDGNLRISVGGDGHDIKIRDGFGTDRIILNGDKGIKVTQGSGGAESPGQFEIQDTQSTYSAIQGKTKGLRDGVMGEAVAEHKSGVYGVTNNTHARGVFGMNKGWDSFGALGLQVEETIATSKDGTSTPAGVYGRSNHSEGAGIIGYGNDGVLGIDSGVNGTGVAGITQSGDGVSGSSVEGVGVWGWNGTSSADLKKGYVSYDNAGYFHGDVSVLFDFWSPSKNFLIDHPLDPENKYLVHTL